MSTILDIQNYFIEKVLKSGFDDNFKARRSHYLGLLNLEDADEINAHLKSGQKTFGTSRFSPQSCRYSDLLSDFSVETTISEQSQLAHNTLNSAFIDNNISGPNFLTLYSKHIAFKAIKVFDRSKVTSVAFEAVKISLKRLEKDLKIFPIDNLDEKGQEKFNAAKTNLFNSIKNMKGKTNTVKNIGFTTFSLYAGQLTSLFKSLNSSDKQLCSLGKVFVTYLTAAKELSNQHLKDEDVKKDLAEYDVVKDDDFDQSPSL